MVYAGYGRGEELEADETGIALVEHGRLRPEGARRVPQAPAERNKDATQKQGLFASHPEMDERLEKLDTQIAEQKLAGTATLGERYKQAITYTPKAQTEIAQVEAGSAGLAGGSTERRSDEKPAAATEEKKKRGFGIGSLLKPGGEEKKSAQVTGSGGSRGVDSERNAQGGDNPALVAVALTPADFATFKKEGKADLKGPAVPTLSLHLLGAFALVVFAVAVRATTSNRLVRRKLRLTIVLAGCWQSC